MNRLVLATTNPGKVRELQAILADSLADYNFTVTSLADHPEIGHIAETGATFLENAMIKARAVCDHTGLVAIADDSGLCVDALDGTPGVHSSRYAGDNATDADNVAKLLQALRGVPEGKRSAHFRCAMVAMAPSRAVITTQGEWHGRILEAPRGSGGFGYDPVFFDPDMGKTAAELEPQTKNALSHRGKAMKALVAQFGDFWNNSRLYPMD